MGRVARYKKAKASTEFPTTAEGYLTTKQKKRIKKKAAQALVKSSAPKPKLWPGQAPPPPRIKKGANGDSRIGLNVEPKDLGLYNNTPQSKAKKFDPFDQVSEIDIKHAEAITRHALSNQSSSSSSASGVIAGVKKSRSRNRSAAPRLEGRREGESQNAFNNRIKFETRALLQNEAKKGSKTVERKKEFLKKKKKVRWRKRESEPCGLKSACLSHTSF